MNPYNQAYPPYQFSQNTPGPPQPQWQAPPRKQGWADPRFPHNSQNSALPLPSYGSQVFGQPPLKVQERYGTRYNPLNQQNTAGWGVRCNQTQEPLQGSLEVKPPLPPRPSSAISHTSQHASQSIQEYNLLSQQQQDQHGVFQSISHSTAPIRQDSVEGSDLYEGHFPTNMSNLSLSSQASPPAPPRPPRPLEYQTQLQSAFGQSYMPHEQYSHRPPSHQYEPQQQMGWVAPATNQSHTAWESEAALMTYGHTSQDHGPVSPIDSDTHSLSQSGLFNTRHNVPAPSLYQANYDSKPNRQPTNFQASTANIGNPSDWEYYAAAPGRGSTTTPPRLTNNTQEPDSEIIPSPPISQISTHETPPPGPISGEQHSGSHRNEVEYNTSGPTNPARKGTKDTSSSKVRPTSRPYISDRHDSDMSSISASSIGQSGTIDSVIQAWSVPAQNSGHQESNKRTSSPKSPNPINLDSSVMAKGQYLYEGLGPELRASLRRFVFMLRKESAAETNAEKFDVFRGFVEVEQQNRKMLYGIQPDNITHETNAAPQLPSDVSAKDLAEESSTGVDSNERPGTQATAEKRNEMQHQTPTTIQKTSPSAIQDSNNVPPTLTNDVIQDFPPAKYDTTSSDKRFDIAELPDTSKFSAITEPRATVTEQTDSSSSALERPKSLSLTDSNTKAADNAVVIDKAPSTTMDTNENGIMYSPGGRPILDNLALLSRTDDTSSAKKPEVLPQVAAEASAISPSNNAPMVLEDYIMSGPTSPSLNAPMTLEYEPQSAGKIVEQPDSSLPPTSINFQPSRPTYTPFRYNAAVETPNQPADMSYSTLRHQAGDSGRLLSHKIPNFENVVSGSARSSTPAQTERDEAFMGLIRTQSRVVRKKTPGPMTISPLRAGTPQGVDQTRSTSNNPLLFATRTLRSVLPKVTPALSSRELHPKIAMIKNKIEAVPDQFDFIRENFVEWDRSNRLIKRNLEDERSQRQTESETHIDALFNDNEIGYSDIKVLEEDFKHAEAERKYEENREELGSFVESVFTPITTKLQSELAELNAQYTMTLDLLDLDSESASRLFNTDRISMADLMELVLLISDKIELRHKKIVEANVERERRRKRLEMTVLYTNGDTAGVKKLESEFATAEKLQVLHEVRSKDTRINTLMDALDRSTVRGLGDNQTFFDDLLPKIQDLRNIIFAHGSSLSPNLYGSGGPRETLISSQEVIDIVLADSHKLLNLSNKADQFLNEADYTVSVAEANVSNSDASTYTKLERDKAKEDGKIAEETNSRLTSIAQVPKNIMALIQEILDHVGDDPEHQERIQKALEVARQRNAGVDLG